MERERALGAHGRRPRRRCWGIDGGHRPALPAEEFLWARDVGPERRAIIPHVSAHSRQRLLRIAVNIARLPERQGKRD